MRIQNSFSDMSIGFQNANQNLRANSADEIEKVNNTAIDFDRDLSLSNKSDYELSVGERALIKAIEDANKKLLGVRSEVRFSIHEKTKEIMIKVINTETKEVIKEIPPEKILDMIAKFMEMSGIFVDERR
ncbi:flagellar protein FlaG [Caloranaerobacter sp. DY30410]|uniref:flagellar protein FlaG n=1 Tax=Caloranaerobacter sp. DY30410 TaxID=3238305 RepID=UPI003CFCA5B0